MAVRSPEVLDEGPTHRDRSALTTALVAATAVAGVAMLGGGVIAAARYFVPLGTWLVRVPVWPTFAMPDSAWWDPLAPGRGGPVVGDSSGTWLWVEQATARMTLFASVDDWLLLPLLGVAVLLLVPVVRNLAGGRLLTAANARQLVALSGLAVLGWALATWLPYLAAREAIAAGASGVSPEWLRPVLVYVWWPLAVAGLLAALAAAVWRGARAAHDAEGLV